MKFERIFAVLVGVFLAFGLVLTLKFTQIGLNLLASFASALLVMWGSFYGYKNYVGMFAEDDEAQEGEKQAKFREKFGYKKPDFSAYMVAFSWRRLLGYATLFGVAVLLLRFEMFYPLAFLGGVSLAVGTVLLAFLCEKICQNRI